MGWLDADEAPEDVDNDELAKLAESTPSGDKHMAARERARQAALQRGYTFFVDPGTKTLMGQVPLSYCCMFASGNAIKWSLAGAFFGTGAGGMVSYMAGDSSAGIRQGMARTGGRYGLMALTLGCVHGYTRCTLLALVGREDHLISGATGAITGTTLSLITHKFIRAPLYGLAGAAATLGTVALGNIMRGEEWDASSYPSNG